MAHNVNSHEEDYDYEGMRDYWASEADLGYSSEAEDMPNVDAVDWEDNISVTSIKQGDGGDEVFARWYSPQGTITGPLLYPRKLIECMSPNKLNSYLNSAEGGWKEALRNWKRKPAAPPNIATTSSTPVTTNNAVSSKPATPVTNNSAASFPFTSSTDDNNTNNTTHSTAVNTLSSIINSTTSTSDLFKTESKKKTFADSLAASEAKGFISTRLRKRGKKRTCYDIDEDNEADEGDDEASEESTPSKRRTRGGSG